MEAEGVGEAFLVDAARLAVCPQVLPDGSL